MIKELLGRVPLVDVLVQGTGDKVLCFVANFVENRFLHINGSRADEMLNLLLGGAWERVSTREKHVGDDSDGPDVYLFVVFLSLNDLWSHVEWTSKHCLESLVWIEKACKSKISYLHVKIVFIF